MHQPTSYRDVVRKPNPPNHNHNPNQLKNKPQPQKVRSLNIAKIGSTLKHLPTIYDKLKKLYAEHKKLLLHEFIEISGLLNHLKFIPEKQSKIKNILLDQPFKDFLIADFLAGGDFEGGERSRGYQQLVTLVEGMSSNC